MKVLLQVLENRWSWRFKYWNSAVFTVWHANSHQMNPKSKLLQRRAVSQCFPNCVPRHTGVPLKKLKCAAKVLCFDKTLCCKSFWSALHCFGF